MTTNEVITYVDGVKPNVYTEEDKAGWIGRLDGMIAVEVHGVEQPFPRSYPEDGDTELLVPFPYDDMYGMYVSAMIDFHNREYTNYNNSVAIFTERLEQYKAWYIRNHAPEGAGNFRNVMG